MKTYTKDGINYLVVDENLMLKSKAFTNDLIIKYNDVLYTFGKSKNTIDTSQITDMSYVFYLSSFNKDISHWDVSNVKYMSYMFVCSEFNQDISSWNVSNVKDMHCMFQGSEFNQDISAWDVSSVEVYYDFNNKGMLEKKFIPKFKGES